MWWLHIRQWNLGFGKWLTGTINFLEWVIIPTIVIKKHTSQFIIISAWLCFELSYEKES